MLPTSLSMTKGGNLIHPSIAVIVLFDDHGQRSGHDSLC